MPRVPVLLAVGLSVLAAACEGGGGGSVNNGNDNVPAAGNVAPTAAGGGVTTDEDEPVTVTLDVDDADRDALDVDLDDDVDHGTLTISGAGRSFRATYTPAPDFNGSDAFAFSVSDGAARSARRTVNITVNAVNDAPVTDAAAYATNEDTSLAGTLAWEDVDSAGFTFAAARQPQHGTAHLQDGDFTYVPDADWHGDDSFSVEVSDDAGSSNTAEITISVVPVNDTPVAVADAATVSEGGAVSVLDGGAASLLANDHDVDLPDDRLTAQTEPVAQPALFATSGSTLLGLDAGGGAATAAATLREPARALAVAGDGHTVYSVSPDGHAVYAADAVRDGRAGRVLRTPLRSIEALARARDDGLVAVTREPGSGTALLVRMDPRNGAQRMLGIIAPQPDATFTGLAFASGSDTLYALAGNSIYALDARNGAATAVAALRNAAARGLVVLADGRVVTSVDGELREVDMLTGDTRTMASIGPDVGALAAGEGVGPAHGTLTLGEDGSFLYTHDGSETLSDSFVYEIGDDAGERAQALVTIAVTPVFDELPAFTSSPALNVNEDKAYDYDASVTDADAGDTIAITGVLPAWLLLADAGDGTATLSGAPSQNAIGTHAIRLVATDAGGNVATQDFSLAVHAVNDTPVFTTDPVQQALVNASYVYDFAASDEDAGDALTFSLVAPLPAWLGLLDHGDGTGLLAGIPVADDIGDVTVSIRVSDPAGAESVQTFVLSVVSTNAGPVFQSAPVASATEGTPYAYHAVATDPNGDALAFSAVTPLPAWLALVDNHDGSADLDGTPGGADAGDHAISIRVSDGDASATQSFTLRVTGVNDAPVITSTPVPGVAEGATYTYELRATDEEGDAIGFSPATPLPPWLGLLDQGGGNALLAGIPIDDDVGAHEISIRATDSHGASSVQTFTLTVTPVNGAPVITSAPCLHATANQTYVCNVTAEDDEGDAITIQPATPLPPWLGLLDAGDGTALLAGIPVEDDIGSVVIDIRAVDVHGGEDTQSFTLTIGASP